MTRKLDERMKKFHTFPLGYPGHPQLSERWHVSIRNYLRIRYPPIVNRLNNSFRYVDLHPANKDTFSFEFASMLRDIGSVFSSALESYLKGENIKPRAREYNIIDFSNFLLNQITDINNVVAGLNISSEENLLFPFEGFEKKLIKSNWWDAYNAVKHTDIRNLKAGCLSNVIYAFSALTTIYVQILYIQDSFQEISGNIIGIIRARENMDIENKIFPKCSWNKPSID